MDVLVAAGIAPSKSEARRLITQGGIYVDDKRISDVNLTIDNKECVIKKGKKTFKKVRLK